MTLRGCTGEEEEARPMGSSLSLLLASDGERESDTGLLLLLARPLRLVSAGVGRSPPITNRCEWEGFSPKSSSSDISITSGLSVVLVSAFGIGARFGLSLSCGFGLGLFWTVVDREMTTSGKDLDLERDFRDGDVAFFESNLGFDPVALICGEKFTMSGSDCGSFSFDFDRDLVKTFDCAVLDGSGGGEDEPPD